MNKFAAMLAFGAVLSAAPAFADPIANAAGNTFVVTYANGAQARYHFNADNTFAAHTPNGHVAGTYELSGGQLCLTPAGGERACLAYAGDKNVGDTWTQTGSDGSQITVTLEAGRAAPHAH
ncbi:MAG TPA: hypothetical protein VEA80_06400 [Vitreimonas sp.]|uniref:hypothetical protein n=1 Tax=Vitreimonas sp. TaxID=3069702 RepID=UPI002D704C9E|nr:hypothetical protein [Vitreimonas sp.]HYD87084.1 hypothetical protein [Vitreimonas sp.]